MEKSVHEEVQPFLDNGRSSEFCYASIENIKPWIPEVDPDHPRAKTFYVKLHQRRTMLIMQASTASTFAVVSLALMVWTVLKYPLVDDTGTFFMGSCNTVHFMDGLWHVVLNVASTLFLGAGNYCMQVLVAPSRKEVREAHKEGVSMEIGVHSFRNVWRISRPKRAIWLVLGVTSTLMHLFWNSAIFSSIPYTIYPVAIVTSDFDQFNDDWSTYKNIIHHSKDNSTIFALKKKAKEFTLIDNAKCIEAHVNPRTAGAELVLVSNITTKALKENSRANVNCTLVNAWESGYDHSRWNGESNWVCSQFYNDSDPSTHTFCTKEWILPDAQNWKVYDSPIQYCLQGKSADNDQRCGLHFSKTIFIVVAVCLVVEAVLVCIVAYIGGTTTMVTLGDAQAEFLKETDECTQLLSEPGKEPGKPSRRRYFARLQVAEWEPTRVFWFKAVGPKMWFATLISMLVALALGLSLFAMSLTGLRSFRQTPSLRNIWNSGIGRINHYMLIGSALNPGKATTQAIVGHILFANIFQVLISTIYLLYNNVLTCQVLADQWTRFMSISGKVPDRKPLRVSSHIGLQRTSYMLSLPRTYAAPMMLAFAAIHTLVSRSVFLVRTAAFDPGSAEEAPRLMHRDASRVGYSSMGILLTILAGAIVLLFLIVNSFRSYHGVPKYLPLMANKTAFISAACQRPEGDKDARLFPVTLMAVDPVPDSPDGSNSNLKRVAFSTDRNAEAPIKGKRYEQPMPTDEHDDWEGIWKTWVWITKPFSGVMRSSSRRNLYMRVRRKSV
ncbi:hypothetical protein K469DRAFT_746163 [Zopfia rhizophila CBS 207.26]|uniref:DUF6536 domain-containing protein n=1 Tax=Zopfia rhizophila CBS 207.26 TaxID=1314779 RepID=A0A6A6ELM7_9PEZI|nr:hypothetical protein K469DRAFT_746163 [Zopfia rhizophila CBS 207.26]